MRNLIRLIDGVARVEDDAWALVDGIEAARAQALPVLPLKLALTEQAALAALPAYGLAFAPDDDVDAAASLLPGAGLVTIEFPTFVDGRGYSLAVLLRTRAHWAGDLRAVGDVLHDQLHYLRRVGFTSFALRADRNAEAALAAFNEFSDSYQASVVPATPAFARRGNEVQA
jgi:uncharacterized protein (DUF934 family)